MKIVVTSVPVEDQDKALAFYTDVLGFIKKTEVPLGEYKWLTVVSPQEQSGVELLLEPMAFEPAKVYQDSLKTAGIPWTSFAVDDVQQEYERLVSLGVEFSITPREAGNVMPSSPKTLYEQELDRLYGDISLPAKQYMLIRQSKRFMEQYYSQRIELNDLAKAAFMSRFHYVRVFKLLYGVTPRNYLRDMRIAKAKELLKSGYSITDACLEVGYESLATFSTTFKKSTGYSPREFQSLHKTL